MKQSLTERLTHLGGNWRWPRHNSLPMKYLQGGQAVTQSVLLSNTNRNVMSTEKGIGRTEPFVSKLRFIVYKFRCRVLCLSRIIDDCVQADANWDQLSNEADDYQNDATETVFDRTNNSCIRNNLISAVCAHSWTGDFCASASAAAASRTADETVPEHQSNYLCYKSHSANSLSSVIAPRSYAFSESFIRSFCEVESRCARINRDSLASQECAISSSVHDIDEMFLHLCSMRRRRRKTNWTHSWFCGCISVSQHANERSNMEHPII